MMGIHQRTILRYLVNHATGLLPPTRCYWFKSLLFRLAGVRADPTCRIVSSVNIWGTSQVSIGAHTFIGHEALITGGDSKVTIGAYVDIGPRVVIVSGTHEIDMIGERSAGKGHSVDISIEDGVWIGAGSTVIGGVTIGRKSVIGAGSLVKQTIPSYVTAVGNPCRPIKKWTPGVGWEAWKDEPIRSGIQVVE